MKKWTMDTKISKIFSFIIYFINTILNYNNFNIYDMISIVLMINAIFI